LNTCDDVEKERNRQHHEHEWAILQEFNESLAEGATVFRGLVEIVTVTNIGIFIIITFIDITEMF